MPGYSATPGASGYRKRRIGIDMSIVQRKIAALRYGKLVCQVQVPLFADIFEGSPGRTVCDPFLRAIMEGGSNTKSRAKELFG